MGMISESRVGFAEGANARRIYEAFKELQVPAHGKLISIGLARVRASHLVQGSFVEYTFRFTLGRR
jgi:hypothetical protein